MSVTYFCCRDKNNENNHDRTIDEVNGKTQSSFFKKKPQKDNFKIVLFLSEVHGKGEFS